MAKFLEKHAYTYDDVLLRPQFSEVLSRRDVDVSVEIVPGIKLAVPIMSANMQAVNSVELCIELSRVGGMATLDQFRDIEKQVQMLKEVKKENAKVAGAIGVTKDYLERAEALVNNKAEVYCNALIIGEVTHVLRNFYKLDRIRIFALLIPVIQMEDLLLENKDLIIAALSFYVMKNVDFVDAYCYMDALNHGITEFYTFDRKHFKRFPNIQILDGL